MMSVNTASRSQLRGLSEVLIVVLVCAAPWAFGAVEAWAELGLYLGVAALTVVGVASGWGTDRAREWLSLPSLFLAGLAVLAVIQVTPLPGFALKVLSPGSVSLRASLLPRAPERVSGDSRPTVALPGPVLSEEPEATTDTAARLIAAWLLFQSVLGLRGGHPAFCRFAAAVAGNATLLGAFSLVQSLSWNGKIYWFRPSPSSNGGPFVCHNHLAAALNVGLGLALGFLFSPGRDRFGSIRRGQRLWAAYAAGLIIVAIVASLSRSAFMAMAATFVATIIVWRPRGLRLGAGFAAIVVLVPLFLFALGTTAPYQQRLATLAESSPYSDRLQIWKDSLRACPVYPVWGLGLGTFANSTARFFQHDTGEVFLHAENEYVEWLVEGGALGLGLYLGFLAAIASSGSRALRAAPSEADRALVLGGLFSGLTLVIHSFGDFALHVPGVAVGAVALAGHLGRLGLDARTGAGAIVPVPRARAWFSTAAGIVLAILSIALVGHGLRRARAEQFIAATDIPLLVSGETGPDGTRSNFDTVDRRREGLEQALRNRPDWAEGHLRLGLTLISLYEMEANEALEDRIKDPEARAVLADTEWLRDIPVDRLLSHDLIRDDLVQAARSFLQARRCCPVLPIPHARLAKLDFLLQGGDPVSLYLGRALRLSGANRNMVALVGRLAVQREERAIAARCWRKSLQIAGPEWESVADEANDFLSPDQILRDVLPDGRLTLWFARRLYLGPEHRETRDRFLKEAIVRLRSDPSLSPAERLQLEAEAWAESDDRTRAVGQMKSALALEPRHPDWRRALVEWLIREGELREAHDQALLGLHLSPTHPETLKALEASAEALARGPPPPPASPSKAPGQH